MYAPLPNPIRPGPTAAAVTHFGSGVAARTLSTAPQSHGRAGPGQAGHCVVAVWGRVAVETLFLNFALLFDSWGDGATKRYLLRL